MTYNPRLIMRAHDVSAWCCFSVNIIDANFISISCNVSPGPNKIYCCTCTISLCPSRRSLLHHSTDTAWYSDQEPYILFSIYFCTSFLCTRFIYMLYIYLTLYGSVSVCIVNNVGIKGELLLH